jgi:H+/Cl- antiporter ClcA
VKIKAFRRPHRLFVEAFLGTRRKLFTFVLIVGLVSGCVGAGYLALMHALQHLLWPTHLATLPHLFVMLGAGAAVAAITWRLGNPGDVELLVNNIHVLGGAEDIHDLRSLIPVSLICISAGGAMGPEAPLVQTTGSLGSWLAHRWDLDRNETRVLTITGMAAGFTVLFGAPLGSAIFALEILHRRGLEYYEALLPAVLGSLSGYAVYAVITGMGLRPVWEFPHAAPLRSVDIAWAVACGVAGAAVAVVFTYFANFLRAAFRRVPVGARPIAGGLALGLLAFWSPYALTFGEAQIDPLIARRALVSVFVVAAGAKLLGTSITLSSGWRGGFIIPLFFMGVALGRLGHLEFHSTNEVVLMTAMMAAINVGVTKTPLGSTLVVTEMAGLALAPSTLVAAVVSLFLTSEVGLIHSQRRREGEFAPGEGPAEHGAEDAAAEGGHD